MITISVSLLILLCWIILVLGIWYIYTTILIIKGRIDKETRKKWKIISQIENIKPTELEKILIKEYIEKYTEEHKIKWK